MRTVFGFDEETWKLIGIVAAGLVFPIGRGAWLAVKWMFDRHDKQEVERATESKGDRSQSWEEMQAVIEAVQEERDRVAKRGERLEERNQELVNQLWKVRLLAVGLRAAAAQAQQIAQSAQRTSKQDISLFDKLPTDTEIMAEPPTPKVPPD